MPSESDRPIEKQLREYAAQRRARAGKDAFALHPVTRNALQVEVEREFGRPVRKREGRRHWLAEWWPRLALAGGSLAVVTLLAVTLIPWGGDPNVGNLAKAESADKSLPPAPTLAAGGKRDVEPSPELKRANESMAVAADSLAPDGQRQEFQFAARKVDSNVIAPASEPPALTARQAESTRTPVSLSRQNQVRQSAPATQAAPGATPPAPPAAPPLQGEFRVVIVADQISLVDADQSSYSGRLEPINPDNVGAAGPNRSLTFDERYYRFVQNGIAQQIPVAAQFVLTGTNLTTRQPVQIVGQMVTRTQAVPSQVAATTPTQQQPPSGVFLQINATATVDAGTRYIIDASTQP